MASHAFCCSEQNEPGFGEHAFALVRQDCTFLQHDQKLLTNEHADVCVNLCCLSLRVIAKRTADLQFVIVKLALNVIQQLVNPFQGTQLEQLANSLARQTAQQSEQDKLVVVRLLIHFAQQWSYLIVKRVWPLFNQAEYYIHISCKQSTTFCRWMCASGAIELLVKGVLPFEEARKEFIDNGAHINQILIFVAVLKLGLLCKL